jgi:hypothetical protein
MTEMAPRVLNAHHGPAPESAVYVGRGSKWGNETASHLPHASSQVLVASRAEAIRLWWESFRASPLFEQLGELRGKDVVCFCAPQACHGDVLVRLANASDRSEEAARVDAEMQPPLTLFDE